MAQHQFDPNANKLWAYFVSVIAWVRSTFPKYRREMKGLDWGAMFDDFGHGLYDTDALEKQIHDLGEDDFRAFDKKQSLKPTNVSKAFAFIVANISSWRKWKQTTSPLGKQAVGQSPRIAKCFAEIVTELKEENDYEMSILWS